ncbi:unnamed protein product [Lactuca virosa]|uniref:Secreted protein n=1 Tax=Lactuca virosa TaxID=75947 RepID=A0AAU9PI40_9ASTR|nr:unnamed protein product [Lactuca virosa]
MTQWVTRAFCSSFTIYVAVFFCVPPFTTLIPPPNAIRRREHILHRLNIFSTTLSHLFRFSSHHLHQIIIYFTTVSSTDNHRCFLQDSTSVSTHRHYLLLISTHQET